MVRLSALRNYPIVCNQRQIGLLQSLCMDTAQKRVTALNVSCGIRGKRMVLCKDIISLADSFILVKETGRYQRRLDTKPCSLIRDTSGLLAGKVTDYAICKSTWHIAAVEMRIGYFPGESGMRLWIYDYKRSDENKGELTVPSSLGSELIMTEEENETCVCQPRKELQ
ncbi:MAG: hypothetical protein IJD60_00630 [Clostridia bacterium]|nr:hypothetical protein [Clostridia bacterium]